tara:strand:- start:1551 stop:1811 length:261 start_codon:yes stop_codon:yes gene_type:complete
MFNFLKNLFQNKNQLNFDSPELKIGSTFISETCSYLIKKGEPPIVFHITDLNPKKKTVSFYTTYRYIKNSIETVYIESFNNLLKCY